MNKRTFFAKSLLNHLFQKSQLCLKSFDPKLVNPIFPKRGISVSNQKVEWDKTKGEEKKKKEEVKEEPKEVKIIKEGKAKYVFLTVISTVSLSLLLTYAYEKQVLYRWNYHYDYYYNPNIKNVEAKQRQREKEKEKEKLTQTDASKTDDKDKKKKGVVKNIILVRHGQYERRFKDDEDKKYLTEEGLKQAEMTGKKLKDILHGKNIDVIYHSNIIRAKETAQIISKYFPNAQLINDPNLDEGTPYLPNPIPKNSKFEAQKIKRDNKRINKAYETYFYRPDGEEDTYQLIICHGNVIRYFLCRALQIPLFAWLRFSSYNCGITWFVLDDEGSVVLREFGSVSHLPFESVTYF